MPAKSKLRKREKLVDLGPEHKAAFERNISWKRICEVFDLEHENVEGGKDGISVACPNCDLAGDETYVTLSSADAVFKCSECATKDGKRDFVIGCFSHDPTVSEVMKLFGAGCFS